jgi:hypothetical protein
MQIKYPSTFTLKVIRNEASGKELADVMIVAPTVVRPSESFSLKIALIDEHGLVVTDHRDQLKITLPNENLNIPVSFLKDEPALAQVSEVSIANEGFFRFETEVNGKKYYSNPIYSSKDYNTNIYWGDPHIHTVLSNCNVIRSRSICLCFNAARYLSALDWVSAADHVSNGRCDLGRWKEQVAASNVYDDSPDFVTLPAYEESLKGYAGGDNNVYMNKFPSLFIDEFEEGNTKTLCEKLEEKGKDEEFEFFIVPHHTSRPKKHGEIPDEIYPGPELMPVVEIHSKWGTSEYRGNPNPLKTIHDGPAFVVDLLNKGLKLGFIGGTDSHSTLTFAKGAGIESDNIDRLPGITAARSANLDRQSIFDSIRHRNCYAASGERIFLDFNLNGQSMGTSINMQENHPRNISIIALGKSDIYTVEIIRNGKTIKKFKPNDWVFKAEYTDDDELNDLCMNSTHIKRFVYYYIRVICATGASAWSSPIWITNSTKRTITEQ